MRTKKKNSSVITVAVVLALCSATASLLPETIDLPGLRGLAQNGRVIKQELQYLSRAVCDTGTAIEACLFFRDESGRRYVVVGGVSGDMVVNRFYRLELRVTGFTPSGLPVARPAGRTALLQEAASPYEGDIRESDPRVGEIKKKISSGEPPPEKIRLRYGGERGDFLSFYDLEGKEILFRFREDRFDDRGADKARGLIAGQAYEVSGRFTGLLLRSKFTARAAAEFAKEITDQNALLVYDFTEALPLRLEQILF
ncbi:MAG: hypothetical protein HY042_02605 [Spirochaetia bacterium]|nr:hypothetical protein [Spirochaetia bacterium]